MARRIRLGSKGDAAKGSFESKIRDKGCSGIIKRLRILGHRGTSGIGKRQWTSKGLRRIGKRIRTALFDSHSMTYLLLRAI